MEFWLALFVGIAWAAFVGGLLYLRQKPEMQVQRRMQLLIKRAETERARAARLKRADEKKVDVKKIYRPSFYQRVILPIIWNVERKLHKMTPTAIVAMLENRIFRAGKQGVWNVQRLAAAWILSIVAGFFIALAVIQQTDYLISRQILILAVGGIFGAAFPFLVLNHKISKRQKEMKRQLPEFLDLLCVSVQAGLSFDGAVAKITARMKGSLTEEFKHMQDDIRFGMTKQYAMTQMAKRCDMEEIYLFTTSIIQAEKLGTSMAQTLTIQADNMRERHRQYVKTEAMKAPIKIIFPMVLFIFPSIFVVLLMPAVIMLIKTLGNN